MSDKNGNTRTQERQVFSLWGTVSDQERVDNVRSCMGQYFMYPTTDKPPINRALLLESLTNLITSLVDSDLQGIHRLVYQMIDNPPGAGAYEMTKLYQEIHNRAVWSMVTGKECPE